MNNSPGRPARCWSVRLLRHQPEPGNSGGTSALQSGFPLQELPTGSVWLSDTGTADMSARKSSANRKAVAERQRDIQAEVAAADKKENETEATGAMQAGARPYPEPPFPKQHQPKPGSEVRLDPQPMYDAPFYIGSKKLEGKVALITGGDSGIGRAVAVLFAREGADVAISYLDEHADAEVARKAVEAEGRRCILLPGNVADRKLLPKGRQANGQTVRATGCPGQQRRLPGPHVKIRGSDARSIST